MTNNQLTREKVQWLHDAAEEAAAAGIKLTMNPNELLMFTSALLAAIDSEPVIADCDPEVYEKGVSACLVVIPKETAEVICKGISAATGCKVDWHYIGGRVHIKALQAALQPAPVVDSDPVAFIDKQWTLVYYVPPMSVGLKIGDKLYRHAQPAPASPVCTCPSGDGSLRWPCPVHAGSSPVIPDGYVLVPMRLTAENGAKGALSGEFSETKFVNCPECFGDDECETCDGSGKIEITVPVTWTTIKAIWVKGVEHFAVTAQEND